MRRQSIGLRHPGSQRYDRQNQRNMRFVNSPEIAVPEEQNADAHIHGTLNPKVSGSLGNNGSFAGIDEDYHQVFRKEENEYGNQQAKCGGCQNGNAGSFADAFCLFCSVVLGDEQGIGVSKFLRRHIGDGVDLHSGGKGGHDGGAKAVEQTLNHQNAKVHNGLLNTRC